MRAGRPLDLTLSLSDRFFVKRMILYTLIGSLLPDVGLPDPLSDARGKGATPQTS